MIIAISSQGASLQSPVDPRFGRAAGFIVYNDESGEHSYVGNNQNMSLAQGAGIQAAMNAANTGAKAVITGHVGPKAYTALSKGGIEIYLFQNGSVAEALEAYKSGKLSPSGGADVEGHW